MTGGYTLTYGAIGLGGIGGYEPLGSDQGARFPADAMEPALAATAPAAPAAEEEKGEEEVISWAPGGEH